MKPRAAAHWMLGVGCSVLVVRFDSSLTHCPDGTRLSAAKKFRACPNTSRVWRFKLIPEIHKLHGHGKFMGAHGGDDGLQIIPALAVHAHFVALNLRRHLELAVADEAGDLLGNGALDALLDLDALPRVAERRDLRVALLHAFQADAALGEPADDDFVERGDFELVG